MIQHRIDGRLGGSGAIEFGPAEEPHFLQLLPFL